MRTILFFTILMSINIFAQKQPNYPNPEKGFKRVDLQLPKIDNEDDYKVEITFSFEMELNICTTESFSFREIETKYAMPPYAYPYYVVNSDVVEVASSPISDCKDENVVVRKKIFSDQRLFEGYSSVFIRRFYIPEYWTLEYRIWKASPEFKSIN